MKIAPRIGAILASTIVLAGCSYDAKLREILGEILPLGVQFSIVESCTPFLGPAVVTFSGVTLDGQHAITDHVGDGRWSRAASLSAFASRDAETYRGVGVGATILDGKACLREITDVADDILFGPMEGFYYRSANRHIVAIVFDEPKGHGIMFLQAP